MTNNNAWNVRMSIKYSILFCIFVFSFTEVLSASENGELYRYPEGDCPIDCYQNNPDIDLHMKFLRAVLSNDDALVIQLKTEGADINRRTGPLGETALMLNMSISAPIDLIKKLLNAGAMVSIENYYGRTVLDYINNEDCRCSTKVIQLLKTTFAKERFEEMWIARRPQRIKEMVCLLCCKKKSVDIFFTQFPLEIIKEVHKQLQIIDTQEIKNKIARVIAGDI